MLRRQLDAVQAEARQLEGEESVVLEAARSLDEDVDAFGEFCDETVGRCARRRRRDGRDDKGNPEDAHPVLFRQNRLGGPY